MGPVLAQNIVLCLAMDERKTRNRGRRGEKTVKSKLNLYCQSRWSQPIGKSKYKAKFSVHKFFAIMFFSFRCAPVVCYYGWCCLFFVNVVFLLPTLSSAAFLLLFAFCASLFRPGHKYFLINFRAFVFIYLRFISLCAAGHAFSFGITILFELFAWTVSHSIRNPFFLSTML